MSKPDEKAEWLNTTMNIAITVHGQTIDRNYTVSDGQIPEEMQGRVQDMVDTLLDTSEI
jgi:hypothetical protein